MKILFLFLFLICSSSYALDFNKIKIDGNTNYSKSNNESLVTNFFIEYEINLYEPSHKKWNIFLGGKLNPQYDHFGNEVKMDVFTVLGISF